MNLQERSYPIVEARPQVMKMVMFTIAGYQLGLPIEDVLRVVNCPAELRGRANPQSDQTEAIEFIPLEKFVNPDSITAGGLGSRAIMVLNLQAHLSFRSQQLSEASDAFLIVTKVEGELCAIRVDAPPDSIEVRADLIRQLPAPYRQGHPLKIADRVAVLPQGKATLAIFLLDMRQVLAVLMTEN